MVKGPGQPPGHSRERATPNAVRATDRRLTRPVGHGPGWQTWREGGWGATSATRAMNGPADGPAGRPGGCGLGAEPAGDV
jgi:hypothetical protein